MGEHPIQSLMDTTLQKIRDMVDVNTIIGDQITTPDGTVIIPVSRVSMGFASGGSDIGAKTQKPMFGGGGGAGVTIKPVAFIAVSNGSVKLLKVEGDTDPAEKAVALVPEMFDKISALFDKNKKNKNENCKCEKPSNKEENEDHCCVESEDDVNC